MSKTQDCAPRTLARHNVGRFVVVRFRTRFAAVVWMIEDPELVGRDDHGGIYQGDLAGAKTTLRGLLR